MNDKNIEKNRYESRATNVLNESLHIKSNNHPEYLNTSIKFYEDLLNQIQHNSKILEVGAGMGENTKSLLKNNNYVISTDISASSVRVMANRFKDYKNFSSEIADIEDLPYEDESFDVVCCAGSLSYGDNDKVLNEIYRVLKEGGNFICIDSLSNIPIYRINRYIHYLKGNRSKSTLKRMPNLKILKKYKKKFTNVELNFFGSITWLFPIMNIFLDEKKIKKISDRVDKFINVKRSSFKFTMRATK